MALEDTSAEAVGVIDGEGAAESMTTPLLEASAPDEVTE